MSSLETLEERRLLMHSRPFFASILLMFVCFVTLSGCELPATGSSGTPVGRAASELLPTLGSEYQVLNGEDVTGAIRLLSTLVTTTQPEIGATIGLINEMGRCLEQSGAASMRVIQNTTEQLEVGVATVVNPARVLSWETLRECAGLQPGSESSGVVIEPCAEFWEYRENSVSYYMFYAGTTQNICRMLCTGMAGCPSR